MAIAGSCPWSSSNGVKEIEMQDGRLRHFLSELVVTDAMQFAVYHHFSDELIKGLAKATRPNAELKCYVTYVQDLPTGNEAGKYLALDFGGSTIRVVLVTLKGERDSLIQTKSYAIPNEIISGTGRALFDHIAAVLYDFVKEFRVRNELLRLGFTFAFPCIQLGLKKALLVRWSKGFSVSGVVNEEVGRLLKEAILRQEDLIVELAVILNDTTGTLVSCAHRNPLCRIGVVLDDGCNVGYMEKVEHVEMLEEMYKRSRKHVIINVEWGTLGDPGTLDFLRTNYDRELDRRSLNRGESLFEKMMGGMYLGELVRLVLYRAIEENLLFTSCAQRLRILPLLLVKEGCFKTTHISEIESDQPPDDFSHTRAVLKELFGLEEVSSEDCIRLMYICECISKRAAIFAALAVSVLINRMDEQKVVVGIDGSLYRQHPKFDGFMRKTLLRFVEPSKQFELMLSEDGSGLGAALIAAVANIRRESLYMT